MQSSFGFLSEGKPMSPLDGLKWTISTIAAGITLTWGAYAVFDTKAEAVYRAATLHTEIESASNSIEKRLERIENKLDRIRK